MKTLPIHKAKAELSKLIRLALRGEEIVIARGKEPLVKLVPVEGKSPQRVIGLFKGQVEIAPDFDAELEDFREYR